MSTNFLVGAVALGALAFAPLTLGQHPVAESLLPVAHLTSTAHKPAQRPIYVSGLDHCHSMFGPTGEGWAAHRHWHACAGADSDDHPHVTEYLHNGPHMYLDVGPESAGGPHDDF